MLLTVGESLAATGSLIPATASATPSILLAPSLSALDIARATTTPSIRQAMPASVFALAATTSKLATAYPSI